jgi:hypothetical protein
MWQPVPTGHLLCLPTAGLWCEHIYKEKLPLKPPLSAGEERLHINQHCYARAERMREGRVGERVGQEGKKGVFASPHESAQGS